MPTNLVSTSINTPPKAGLWRVSGVLRDSDREPTVLAQHTKTASCQILSERRARNKLVDQHIWSTKHKGSPNIGFAKQVHNMVAVTADRQTFLAGGFVGFSTYKQMKVCGFRSVGFPLTSKRMKVDIWLHMTICSTTLGRGQGDLNGLTELLCSHCV